MAMKKEDKLTKQMVIDGVLAIIRPAKARGNGDNRGATLLRAMLARAKTPTPTTPPITQPARASEVNRRGR